MKGDIHRYVLSMITFPCDIGELRNKQNNTRYRITRNQNFKYLFVVLLFALTDSYKIYITGTVRTLYRPM